jgi:hypothetical protein
MVGYILGRMPRFQKQLPGGVGTTVSVQRLKPVAFGALLPVWQGDVDLLQALASMTRRRLFSRPAMIAFGN